MPSSTEQTNNTTLSFFHNQIKNILGSIVETHGDLFPPSSTPSTDEDQILAEKIELTKSLVVNFPKSNEIFFSPLFLHSYPSGNQQQKKPENSADASKNKKSNTKKSNGSATTNINNNNNNTSPMMTEEDQDTDVYEPFTSESEFILSKHAQFIVFWWHRAVATYSPLFNTGLTLGSGAANAAAHTPANLLSFPSRTALLQVIQQGILQFHSAVTHYINRRLRVTPVQPRVLRLGAALKMSPSEVEALVFVLVYHCSTKLPLALDRDFTNTCHHAARYANMSSRELMYFAGPSRAHCKQGVLTFPDRWSPPEEARIKMTQVVASALSGASLSQEETVKLEKTALCDLMMDDGAVASGLIIERADSGSFVGGLARGLGVPVTTTATTSTNNNTNNNNNKSSVKDKSTDGKKIKKKSGTRRKRDDNEDDDTNANAMEKAVRAAIKEENRIVKAQLKKLKKEKKTAGGDAAVSDSDSSSSSSSSESVDADDLSSISLSTDKDDDENENNNTNNNDTSINVSPTIDAAAIPPTMNNNDNNSGTLLLAANNNNNQQQGTTALAGALDGVDPYTDDKSYMEDAFQALAALIKTRNAEGDMKDEDSSYFFNPKTSAEAQLRELKGKQRLMQARLIARLEATRKKGNGWLPHIEQLGDKLGLSEFEKLALLLLVGNVISQDILIAINGRYVHRDGAMQMTVGYILYVLCETLAQRIAGRKSFTKDAPLVKTGIININPPDGRNSFTADLVEFAIDIDRKIVDSMVGLETSPGELVQGSKLYNPTVSISDVVLPKETKEVVMSAVEHYHLYAECASKCGLRAGLASNASALCILLSGPSGTGKTLLANALANNLKKKILLVNANAVKNNNNPGDVIRFLFREAKLNGGAVVFFDECETLFETRTTNAVLTSLLAEFELFDGVVVLATNRANIIDEAMNRRISVVIEFKNPDHKMRREIWTAHLPQEIKLNEDVNLEKLALNYELSGGLIKNAMLSAIRSAVEREKSSMPSSLTMKDLEKGAKSQLRGLFASDLSSTAPGGAGTAANRIITPSRTLDDIVLDTDTLEQMNALIRKIKSRNVLFSQWGFEENGSGYGSVVEPMVILIKGSEGNGKSLFAEIVAHECGLNMRIDNLAAMILKGKDIVSEMQSLFDEAKNVGAAVVLDGAEEMFGNGEQAEQTATLLQYHANRFRRPIFLLAKTHSGGAGGGGGGGVGAGRRDFNVDVSQCSAVRFTDVFSFTLPNNKLRERMWRTFVPTRVPLGDDINWSKLAELSLTAKAIRSICFNACSMAAMEASNNNMEVTSASQLQQQQQQNGSGSTEVRLTMKYLQKAAKEYMESEQKRRPASSMFL